MICAICPRDCHAERTEEGGCGYCAESAGIRLARAGLHRWEEPCLSGTRGAGAVFFSGCNLRCVFCQNEKISHRHFGTTVSATRLRAIFMELIAQGAHNIDLVSPTHFTPWIAEALREPLPVPVVWNSNAYENVQTLRLLQGRVQVYLPDLKYVSTQLSAQLSDAEDYFAVATAAILEMYRQTGPYVLDGEGMLVRGVLIRHLMLPGCLEDTKRVIDWVAETFRSGEVLFSLMRQYTPYAGAEGQLARRVRGAEYRAALAYLDACGIVDGYTQERESAQQQYTPDFDLSGI